MTLKFKVANNHSKIFDFIEFPKLIFLTKESLEKDKQNSNYDIVSQEDIEVMFNISNKLAPFKNKIEEFYGENISFIGCIRTLHSFFKYNSIDEYLKSLLELDEYTIKYKLLYGIMIKELDGDYNETYIEKAKEKSKEQNEIVEYIKKLPLDSSLKWNFFCIFGEPKKYVEKYVDLMNNILPIFNEIYSSLETEIKTAAIDLIKDLEDHGIEYVSNDILTVEALPTDLKNNELNIVISLTEPYSIGLRVGSKDIYLSWGFKVKETMEKIRKINEDKINERIVSFKNLGDRTRYEVLKLVSKGICSTKIIAENLGVSSATISYHLSNLTTAKLIKVNKDNSTYGYEVNYEYIEWVISEFKSDIKGDIQ